MPLPVQMPGMSHILPRMMEQTLANDRRAAQAAQAWLKHGQGTIVDMTQARQPTAQMELRPC